MINRGGLTRKKRPFSVHIKKKLTSRDPWWSPRLGVLQEAEVRPGVLPPEHYGGRPSRSAEDATLQMAQFISDAHAVKRTVGLLTVDVSGAYNAVQPAPLLQDLRTSGWPTKVRRWAASFLTNRSTRIRVGDYTGPAFDSSGGLPQGSPISQLMWITYSKDLVSCPGRSIRSDPTLSIGWVDDWNVLVTGSSGRELHRRLDRIARSCCRS